MSEIRHYLDDNGHDLFAEWREELRDPKARIAIDRRINRMELGNFGDHKALRDGVWELRIDVGPGYRVYFAQSGLAVILLLCGGDKRKQDADISRACDCWRDWKRKNSAEKQL
ncbi:MAG: type II toxin-antitoxin system RelE/ParE family toxin [Desulfovibrio sp.]|jgi:putative addiction module killer protein|nr:type II toxin-antitoxin system RelE/ParE family toxin [Desulfovibrio sp.]